MNKLAMRRLWFQLHKWIGLLLVVLIVPIALSGAALVWGEALDRLLDPARHATSGTTLLPLQRYLDTAQQRASAGLVVANVVLPDGAGPVAVTLVAPPRAGERRPARTMVYLDPPTARVLDIADNRRGVMRTLHLLHGSLLIPGIGRQIVGWIGIALMVSCFTGLWLWWPVVGRWVRGLRWRRQATVDANLHHLAGFWIALPLSVLSLTGAWISFPRAFGALVGEAPRDPGLMARMLAPPLARPALSIDQAVARGRPLGPAAAIRTIVLPTQRNADWTLAFATQPMVTVAIADDSGVAARSAAFGAGGSGSVAQTMRRLHDGNGMGPAWQVLIFLGGVLPVVLGVTGVLMWWRARRWRKALARKRGAT
jgi:uncharacterized iron-regulated membrane protein